MEEVYGLSLEELERRWREYIDREALGDPLFPYYRGVSLMEAGQFPQAKSALEKALASGNNQMEEKAALELGILSFYLGQWEEALSLLMQVSSEGLAESAQTKLESYKSLATSYRNAKRFETPDLVVYLPPQSSAEGGFEAPVSRAQRSLVRATEILAIDRERLPQRFFAFISSPEDKGRFSSSDLPRNVIAVSDAGDSLGREIVGKVSSYLEKDLTYSHLLRGGLAHYLGDAWVDYFHKAAKVLGKGEWIPLEYLSGASPDEETIVDAEGAAFVGYLLEKYEWEKFQRVWRITSPLNQDRSLMGAILDTYGLTFEQLEARLKAFLEGY